MKIEKYYLIITSDNDKLSDVIHKIIKAREIFPGFNF